MVRIRPLADGRFEVIPQAEEGATLVTVTVQGKVAHLPVTVGMKTVVVEDFEDPSGWEFQRYPSSGRGALSFVPGPTANSQLSDRKEAALIEKWLAEAALGGQRGPLHQRPHPHRRRGAGGGDDLRAAPAHRQDLLRPA